MKFNNSISWVLRITITVIFLQTLYFKFTAHPDSVYIFSKLGLEPYGRIGLGITELITAILILLPRTKILGLFISFGIICGAIFSHLLVIGIEVKGDSGGLFTLALIVLFVCVILFFIHRNEIQGLIKNIKKMKTKLIYLLFLTSMYLTGCAQKSSNQNKETINNSFAPKIELTEQEWKTKLTPEQYYILREKGTEKPFKGEFIFTKEKGTYKCAGCGEPLFTDDMKFDSHCGWPSFDNEIAGGKIIQTEDLSHGMRRTEITCAKCGGHLGHIFEDGPTKTGKRYCVNSGSLLFEPKKNMNKAEKLETIYLAGGCFWCIEAIFEDLKGVQSVLSGYSGGSVVNPTYKQVCTGNTGHAEVVQITYDSSVISFEELLEVFFTLHDPTTLNRQGADVGTQYRSAIFYTNENQKKIAEKIIVTLNTNKAFNDPIVTQVSAFKNFFKAENYHQEYYELNKEEPYCKMVIKPKVDKLHKIFAEKLKTK